MEKLIELFEPFILLNEHDFVAENVEKLAYALVPEEQGGFRLRYPRHRLVGVLDQHSHSGAAQMDLSADRRPSAGSAPSRATSNLPTAESNGETIKTGTNGATWRYS